MKSKHWQGYGPALDAKKVSKRVLSDGTTQLVIKVKGNHEWGLKMEGSPYRLFDWLIKKVDKTLGKEDVRTLHIQYTCEDSMEGGEEVCVYYIMCCKRGGSIYY